MEVELNVLVPLESLCGGSEFKRTVPAAAGTLTAPPKETEKIDSDPKQLIALKHSADKKPQK